MNRPNIVTAICHDMGQEIGCYGSPDACTPNFDQFAAEGVRFENSFCTAPGCSPSRAALWTGRYPHSNGVTGLVHGGFKSKLHPNEVHFAQMMKDAGYDTHVFGQQHVDMNDQRLGFAHSHGRKGCAPLSMDVVDFISERGHTDTPLFVQVAIFEPHRPFPHSDVDSRDPATMTVPPWMPDIPTIREDLADMHASITSADKAFGRIVQALKDKGMMENTIVLFTVDHGIPYPHAKMTLYDPGISVPLIMQIPGIAGGKVFQEKISNVDVVPTLLELLDRPLPDNLQGRSFKPLLDGTPYEAREAIFAEKTYHTYYDPMRAIRTDKWKLIANFEFAPWQEVSPDYSSNAKSYVECAKARPYPEMYHPPFELYDLDADPHEQNNLAEDPTHAATRDDLIRQLRQWMDDTGDPLLNGPMAQGAYVYRMAAFEAI